MYNINFNKIEKIQEKFDSTLDNEVGKSLRIIKKRIEKIFLGTDFKTYSEYSKSTNGVLVDSNLTLLDSKIITADPLTDYYKIRLADEEYEYSYSFLITLDDNFKEYSQSKDEPNRILNTDLTFKKYDITGEIPELVSEINRTIPINTIDEDLFINLNIEADEYDDSIDDVEVVSDEDMMNNDNVIPDAGENPDELSEDEI